MDLTAVRSLVREANFGIHGVPAHVTPPAAASVLTRIIWADREAAAVPGEGTFQRSEPRRVMAIRRDDLDAVPRGTIVEVTEHLRDEPARWRVDSTQRIDSEHIRVVVVPDDLAT